MSGWYWSPIVEQLMRRKKQRKPYDEPPQVGDRFVVSTTIDRNEDVAIGLYEVTFVSIMHNMDFESGKKDTLAIVTHRFVEGYVPHCKYYDLVPEQFTVQGNFEEPAPKYMSFKENDIYYPNGAHIRLARQ